MSGRSLCGWLKYVFWQGQELEPAEREAQRELKLALETAPWHKSFLTRHRRLVSFLIPAMFFHFFWWAAMIKNNAWHLLVENYYMSLTMIFGSMMAGMTSVGGGAVAFPVMTLAFSVTPAVARDFSVLIQSCGMSAASFAIIFMRIICEWRVLAISSVGGLFGLVFGIEYLDPLLSPNNKKLGYVSVWFSFASVLLILIIFKRGSTCFTIKHWNKWKVLLFVVTGFCGGICTALSGNGIDICTFSVMTLVFKVNEKVATPTTVILMAGNSICCVIWRGVILGQVSKEAWSFFAACVPIVVLGAPLGSILGSHFHRIVLSLLVVILDTISLIAAFVVIPMSLTVGLVMGGIIVVGIAFFALLAYIGHRLQSQSSDELECVSYIMPDETKEGELVASSNHELEAFRREELSH